MFTTMKKATLATALAASALASASPAVARDHYRHRGNDTAAIAVGAGILGLAIGAIATSNNRRDRYDDRYYNNGYYYRDGYYYNQDGRRYHRNDWQRHQRWDRDDYRRGYGNDVGSPGTELEFAL